MNTKVSWASGRARLRASATASAIAFALATLCGTNAAAQSPVTTCDAAGIGSVTLVGDGPAVTIESVSTGTVGSGAAAVPYCLVKVLVPQAIHIWVGLPMGGKWNGRWQSLGGGVFAGQAGLAAPTSALQDGYAGATTDTGHAGGPPRFPPFLSFLDGSFGMLSPGLPNVPRPRSAWS